MQIIIFETHKKVIESTDDIDKLLTIVATHLMSYDSSLEDAIIAAVNFKFEMSELVDYSTPYMDLFCILEDIMESADIDYEHKSIEPEFVYYNGEPVFETPSGTTRTAIFNGGDHEELLIRELNEHNVFYIDIVKIRNYAISIVNAAIAQTTSANDAINAIKNIIDKSYQNFSGDSYHTTAIKTAYLTYIMWIYGLVTDSNSVNHTLLNFKILPYQEIRLYFKPYEKSIGYID